jgi:xanthine dehydrogenase small subunit
MDIPPPSAALHQIRYLRAGAAVRAPWTSNTRTVLQHLREDLRLHGTREGCASGDCGACLVVLGELRTDGSGVEYRTHNACLLPLAALHGRLLLTVEDLADGPRLHPVQQALVDCHGSQCGFCTPGFVMALYGHYLAHREWAGEEAVHRQLAGNLCRCTGYAPILRAARAMHGLPRRDRDVAADAKALRALHEELDPAPVFASPDGSEWCALPASASQAAQWAAAHPDATFVAGATDVAVAANKALRPLPRVIHLSRAEDLQSVREEADEFVLGAGASIEAAFRRLQAEYPELEELGQRFASPSIRGAATLGGNIANGSPVGDSMPALIALGAQVVLIEDGRRRTLPLEALFLGYRQLDLAPGGLVAEVRVPRRRDGLFLRAYKVGKRFDDDISIVCLAIAVQLSGERVAAARIGCGGLAPVPARAPAAEAALAGRAFDAAAAQAAAAALACDLTPISDHRGSAGYRLRAAGRLLVRAVHEYQGHAARVHPFEVAA